MSTIKGYVLTLAGCPYVFTHRRGVGVTSADPLWFGDETGVQIADGWLMWPDWEDYGTGRPLDGDVEQDAYRFKLHDAPIDSGTAAGYMLFTFLTTQDIADIPSSL
jgi:hypothetical protein